MSAWADSLRAELASSGVGVTVISPGYVNTNLSRNALTSSGRNKTRQSILGSVLSGDWDWDLGLGTWDLGLET